MNDESNRIMLIDGFWWTNLKTSIFLKSKNYLNFLFLNYDYVGTIIAMELFLFFMPHDPILCRLATLFASVYWVAQASVLTKTCLALKWRKRKKMNKANSGLSDINQCINRAGVRASVYICVCVCFITYLMICNHCWRILTAFGHTAWLHRTQLLLMKTILVKKYSTAHGHRRLKNQ